MFAYGYGKYPPGHPGNNIGLDHGNGPSSSSSFNNGKTTSIRPGQPSSSSRSKYAQVPQMRPHDPIPPPSRAAEEAAAHIYKKFAKSESKLTGKYVNNFKAWKATWHFNPTSSSAQARCAVKEFDDLLRMGPSILPLVVYTLLDPANFTAIFLYNALERDTRYLVDPSDVLNYLTLQRQCNLVIDINRGRKC